MSVSSLRGSAWSLLCCRDFGFLRSLLNSDCMGTHGMGRRLGAPVHLVTIAACPAAACTKESGAAIEKRIPQLCRKGSSAVGWCGTPL